MLLILSDPKDETAQIVARKLEERGADLLWLDDAQFPAQAQISLACSATDSPRETFRLRLGGQTYDLGRITAAWDRRPGAPVAHVEIEDANARQHVERQSRHFLNDVWHSLDCLWVPGPRSSVQQAERKAFQLRLARDVGFEIPPTLITNSPEDFLEFYRRHQGALVSKGLRSGFVWAAEGPPRSKVRAMVYTEVVTNRDTGYAAAVRYCPVIFQAYVPKRVELRITVVGERIFAAEIRSQETSRTRHDWRHYDLYHTPHRAHDLPDEIQQLCRRLVEQLGLCFGAIDMILTPDGRYVFLEINPNGQYGWIEDLTGLPISDAMCDLLMSREDGDPASGGSTALGRSASRPARR